MLLVLSDQTVSPVYLFYLLLCTHSPTPYSSPLFSVGAMVPVPRPITGSVGKDSTEGHCIKAMLSIAMVEVLEARSRPDEFEVWAASSTISYLLIVCGGCNKALQA